MRGSILILSMLILVSLVASIVVVGHVAANSTPVTASAQAEKGNDDTLYLRRFTANNLTTTTPTSTIAANITLGGGSSTTRRWVNETAVPSGQTWNIAGGDYNFTFWIMRNHENIVASVTFSFGYIDAAGQSVVIATGTLTSITPPLDTVTKYYITTSGTSTIIGSGSKLFIAVTINVAGPPGRKAFFYYDGTSQPTQIKTPPISAVVPEFPFGAVFLPLALLSAYFILRRHIVRFKM